MSLTIGQLYEICNKSYGKNNRDSSDIFPFSFQNYLNNLLRPYDLWFKRINPDIVSLTQMFHAGTTPAPDENGWVYTGILYTTKSITKYMFPDKHKVDKLLAVNQIDTANGKFKNIIPVLDYEMFLHTLAATGVGEEEEPTAVTLLTEGKLSALCFNPVPDAGYLYAIQYSLMDLPELIAPTSSHYVLENYPELCRMIGILVLAESFHDYEVVMYCRSRIEGDRNSGNRGLLQDLLQHDLRKKLGSRDTFRVTNSKRASDGLSNAYLKNENGVWRPPYRSY